MTDGHDHDYIVVLCSNCRAEVEVEVTGDGLRQTAHARTGWPDADCDLTPEDIENAMADWEEIIDLSHPVKAGPWTFTYDDYNRLIACVYQDDPGDPRSSVAIYDGDRVTSCIHGQNPTHPDSYVQTWDGDHRTSSIHGRDPSHPLSWDKREGATS